MGLIAQNYYLHQVLARHYSLKTGLVLTSKHILEALFMLICEKEDMTYPLDMWDTDMSFKESTKILDEFDFRILIEDFELDIIPDFLLMQRRARFKVLGQIWVIHKYDADPFPSTPHAHNVEDNIKVDLSNGKCFRKKELVYQLSRKALIEFRSVAGKVFKGDLPLLSI